MTRTWAAAAAGLRGLAFFFGAVLAGAPAATAMARSQARMRAESSHSSAEPVCGRVAKRAGQRTAGLAAAELRMPYRCLARPEHNTAARLDEHRWTVTTSCGTNTQHQHKPFRARK